MAGRGTAEDARTLLASDFWQQGRDGRSSRAMLALIEGLRVLKHAARPVDLFAFDDQPGTELERNVAIATGLRRSREAHPDTRNIALMGVSMRCRDRSGWGERD